MEQEIKELELHMEILEEQSGTVTTLGDLYGYNVFSEEFGEHVLEYQIKQAAERESNFRNVFYQEPEDKVEQAFQTVFDAQMQMVVRADNMESGENSTGFGFAVGFMLIGMFLTGSILFLIEKWRRRKKDHAGDNNSDWTQYEKV